MNVFFALSGLYLYLEKGYAGRQARQAHVDMARHENYDWPVFSAATNEYSITVADVLAVSENSDRDATIHKWAKATLQLWSKERETIIAICEELL